MFKQMYVYKKKKQTDAKNSSNNYNFIHSPVHESLLTNTPHIVNRKLKSKLVLKHLRSSSIKVGVSNPHQLRFNYIYLQKFLVKPQIHNSAIT